MFTSKIFKVAYAITIAEGWKPRYTEMDATNGSKSYINHNPGNLKASPYQIDIDDEGFAIFENDFVGFYAIVHQLYLYATDKSKFTAPNDSVEKAISAYNGAIPGQPIFENYIKIIEQIAGVSRNDKIESLLT